MADQRDDNYSGVWDSRMGFGNKTALVVIDLLQGYTTEGSPLFAPGVVKAVAEMPELLKAARATDMPIIHTQVRYNPHTFIDGGVWIKKAPVLKSLVEGDPYAEFCEGLEPCFSDIVTYKSPDFSFNESAYKLPKDESLGLNISIVTTANTDAEGKALLTHLGMPFRQLPTDQGAQA